MVENIGAVPVPMPTALHWRQPLAAVCPCTGAAAGEYVAQVHELRQTLVEGLPGEG
jgi:hypothetical protein